MKKLPFSLLPIACCLLFIVSSCGGSETKTGSDKKDKYEQTKESLAETEKKNPVRFLSASVIRDKKNLFGQTVVKGEITNHATVATYKDVEVKILYYSKTSTLLMESVENVYEKIAPGQTASFKTKEWVPKGTDSVVLKVVGAKGE